MSALLQVRDLAVELRGTRTRIVECAEFEVARGEIVALVGESGSGKTTLALAVPRLLSPALALSSGTILFEGRDLACASEAELSRVRGARIGVLFQDPLGAFNPVLRVGEQVGEGLRVHRSLSRDQTHTRVLELLQRVELGEVERVADSFPHELSGGMRQRAALAMALACEPALLIADEPTSALDATTGAAVLALVRRLAREADLGVLLVTHDLRAVASIVERVLVMYAGALVEHGAASDVLRAPAHPYTRALLASSLARARRGERLQPIPGQAPLPHERPGGCAFHPRCAHARGSCALQTPGLAAFGNARAVACPFHAELGAP